ncbi:endoplasmic reticulum protein [Artomyces pyxidatus]|uniref:Endoplasmic reticulum protein n=1 Tax=Artomyces pyxidatus TaxID=48021 RepID=A0ACB8THF5_9AGAM|nr:endoplasmic reticulum protein [Artomyces pyxidatus]
MLRVAIARSVPVVRAAVVRSGVSRSPVLSFGIRYNSSKPLTPEQHAARRAILDARDSLQKDWTAPVISYEAVKQKSQQPSEDAYLIDVREPDEVVSGMIPSAVNLPLSVLSGSLQLPEEQFVKKFGFKRPSKDQEIVFYCRSGKRSASAGDVAKRNGYSNILNYEGSWLDWASREGKTAA